MSNLLIKLIGIPITLYIASSLLPGLGFTSFYQPFLIGLVIALVDYIIELYVLKRGTVWITAIIDLVVATMIALFLSPWIANTTVSFYSALIIGFIIMATEYVMHVYIVGTSQNERFDI